ncbi:hypothetical protein G7054_g1591 [Neopestalotiopsis clavispora]|nr:hypothetical protein G7054_g1591 [Neopestalotiopsis clavispora]
MTRKRKLPQSDIIHDLSTLIEVRIVRQIHDGTKRKRASLYLVEARPIVNGQQHSRAPPRRSDDSESKLRSLRNDLVLKIYNADLLIKFPSTRACEDDYKREVAANAELSQSAAAAAASSPTEARDAMFGNPGSSSELLWPHCHGTFQIAPNPIEGEWTTGNSTSEARRGIIFDHLAGLQMLQKADVTEELANDIKQLFGDLHAIKLLHRDHINHAIWPLIGFNNLFLQSDSTGKKNAADHLHTELFILDFDKALVLGDSARDNSRLVDEANRLEEILEQAMAKQDETEDLSAEVKRLLAGRG